jgi:hypothetical protein
MPGVRKGCLYFGASGAGTGAGAAVGAGVVVGAGPDSGTTYQTSNSARMTAATIVSVLFSIGFLSFFCPFTVGLLWLNGNTVQIAIFRRSGLEKRKTRPPNKSINRALKINCPFGLDLTPCSNYLKQREHLQ